VWIGPEGAAAAVPAVLLLAYTGIGSPLQVGSELLVGVGRAGAVLRAAALAIVVNTAASLLLIGPLGVNGVFVATIISATVLFPLLGRAILAEIGVPLRPFMDEVVAPVLLPTLLLTIAVAGVLALGLDDLPTVVLGGAAGGLAYGIGVWRTALLPEEQDGLRRLLRRPVPGSSGVSRVATP
jgi:O-antigen/teichoic acid export membrane protein